MKAVCGSHNASCVEFAGGDLRVSGKLTANDQQRVSHGVTPQRPEGQRLGIPADRGRIIHVATGRRQWRSGSREQSKLRDASCIGNHRTGGELSACIFVPAGTPDNSPPFQRWDRDSNQRSPVRGDRRFEIGPNTRTLGSFVPGGTEPSRGCDDPPLKRWAIVNRPWRDEEQP